MSNPYDKQVGGDHYSKMKIQPAEFINENKLLFAEGNAIKYICRHRSKGKEKDIKKARDKALEIIDFVDLIEKRHHFAKELSTGQRKRLEMARAMAIEPKLFLMDEVTGGVDQKTIPGLVELIKKLKKTGVTIITIEHNINIIMEISDNVLALDQGKRIAFGPPKEIQKNKQVIDAYLGTFDAA